MNYRIILLTALTCVVAMAADRPAPRVWAIGEGFRVDPLTGNVREEQRLGGNPIPADFHYTERNLAWDGKRINIAAARNEVVAFQLQVRGPAKNVTVSASGLKALEIELFRQWYINVTTNSSNKDSTTAGYNLGKGWYADALVPLGSGSFQIPDPANAIPNQAWQGIWVDVYVPRDARPGKYTGAVTVAGDGFRQELPLDLTVFPATLPDDFATEVALNNYGSIGHKGSEMRLRYYQMARRHRLAIHEHYIAPKLDSWTDYDAEMGKYFTGEAFTAKYGYRGPGEGRPIRWAYLPFEILKGHAWPLPPEQMHTPAYDETVRRKLREFARHFEEKGWTSTQLMFFINGLDEPTKPSAIQAIRYFGDLVKSVNAPRVSYRADINHLHDIGREVPGWSEQRMLDVLGPVINLWVMVADFQRTDFTPLLELRKRDPKQVVWFYQNREPSVGGYTLDDETIGLATWPVIAWKYGLDGCVLWECTYAGPSKNVWVDPNNSVNAAKGQVHNLAALMMYPGRPGIAEPVASIRLKSFRRGAQDYEYLRLLEKVHGRAAAMKLLDRVLGHALHEPHRPYGAPGDWSHNPEAWNRMRLEALRAIGGE